MDLNKALEVGARVIVGGKLASVIKVECGASKADVKSVTVRYAEPDDMEEFGYKEETVSPSELEPGPSLPVDKP